MTQIQIKLTVEEKLILERASFLLGLGHSTFCRQVSLERARDLLQKFPQNNPSQKPYLDGGQNQEFDYSNFQKFNQNIKNTRGFVQQ